MWKKPLLIPVLSLVLLLSLLLALLPAFLSPSEDAAEKPLVSYDAARREYTVAGWAWANLFEYFASPDRNYLIYVVSTLNGEPDAWLYDREEDTHQQLTDNGYFIESQPRVDDRGNWALALTEASMSRSSLLCNGETITDNQLLNRSLCFWKNRLFYAAWNQSTGTSDFFLYDPETKETAILASRLPLSTGLSAAGGDAILLEAYDAPSASNTVLAIYPELAGDKQIQVLSGGDSFLIFSDGEPQILQVSGDDNAKYYFNACYWLNRYQSGEPWSGSPDSAGRVSWNESYRLFGLLELWEKTGDVAFRDTISTAVRRLISTREAAYQSSGQERDCFLFVTKKYSLDQQAELRALVNNAMVYYPMLRAANLGCLGEGERQTLLSMAEDAFRYYEEDWDPDSGCYRSRKGDPLRLDGSVRPFNQQNVFGLCLIEMYKATGNAVYRDRCVALARTFAKEIELTEDGRAIWHYWPQQFYEGWTEADGVSENTPVQAPIDNPSYEDTSHAALNASFIFEYYTFFGDTFSLAQFQGLRRTLDAICTDSGVSSLLEPLNTDKRELNSLWVTLVPSGEQETTFARRFLLADTFTSVEYDSQIPQIFARLYDPEAGGTLCVSVSRFTGDSIRTLESFNIQAERVPVLAARLRMVPIS